MQYSVFVIGVVIAVIYLIFKFIEMKYILKENKPVKKLFRDTVIVYISVVVGYYTLNQISSDIIDSSSPEVFTGNPGF
tara:strand:- start:449 stop:682 length:234 start_codon:yes stop_codon:yes gene_type:complete